MNEPRVSSPIEPRRSLFEHRNRARREYLRHVNIETGDFRVRHRTVKHLYGFPDRIVELHLLPAPRVLGTVYLFEHTEVRAPVFAVPPPVRAIRNGNPARVRIDRIHNVPVRIDDIAFRREEPRGSHDRVRRTAFAGERASSREGNYLRGKHILAFAEVVGEIVCFEKLMPYITFRGAASDRDSVTPEDVPGIGGDVRDETGVHRRGESTAEVAHEEGAVTGIDGRAPRSHAVRGVIDPNPRATTIHWR